MPDQSLSKTTEHPLQSEKKINPRDGVFSQTIKQKNESFLPPLKTEISLKKNRTKNSLHYSVLVSLS